jgi:repressor LexA
MTPQQQNTLHFIREYLREHGHAPTLMEIGTAVGVRSKGAVHRLVQALVDQGHLLREPASWRGLRLAEQAAEPTLPLLGRIAAGLPIEAIPGEDTLNLTDFLLGPRRYALRVIGESMIGAGILNGDTVVVEQCDTARDGEIVVALIDDQEATLKRLKRRKDGTLELRAENPAMPPLIYPATRVRIQGVVVAQLRSYR